MEVPGNLWQEAWSNAKPVPARRQKRLFDDTRYAILRDKICELFGQIYFPSSFAEKRKRCYNT